MSEKINDNAIKNFLDATLRAAYAGEDVRRALDVFIKASADLEAARLAAGVPSVGASQVLK